jgi:hypothetical protein
MKTIKNKTASGRAKPLLLWAAVSAAMLLPVTPAPAQVVQESMSEQLLGGAGSNNYGGVNYSGTSTTFDSNLSFDLYYPGYASSSSTSSGGAGWTDTSTTIQYSDEAGQMVSATPTYTNYSSIAQMNSTFTDNFHVTQTSDMTLTATLEASPGPGGSSSGSVSDNNLVIYSWSGNAVLSTPIVLHAGDEIVVNYGSIYATLDFTSAATFSNGLGSSFEINITPVPESSTYAMLGLGALCCGGNVLRRKIKTAKACSF